MDRIFFEKKEGAPKLMGHPRMVGSINLQPSG